MNGNIETWCKIGNCGTYYFNVKHHGRILIFESVSHKFTFSNNISPVDKRPIANKFHLKHQCSMGKQFGFHRSSLLVKMGDMILYFKNPLKHSSLGKVKQNF